VAWYDGKPTKAKRPVKKVTEVDEKESTSKKTKKKLPVDNNYGDWERDLGFLMLVMSRKKNITKNYYINIFSTQLSSTDYIRDEDLEEIISGGVVEVLKELSQNYVEYLITKYFRSEEQLVKFVTEEFYVDLTSAAINQNNSKIRDNMIKKKVNEMSMANGFNNDDEEPKDEKNEK
jgi:hypothetical protein